MDREQLIKHFKKLDRKAFVPEQLKPQADAGFPLPIGYGQTISQATLVLEMTALLDPSPEHRVLEIGTGSGYQTALLSPFCKTIYTIERIAPLLEEAKKRLDDLGYTNIVYKLGDGSEGWPEEAPFDRILAAAAAASIPQPLIEQLASPGRLIMPVGERDRQDLVLVTKDEEGNVKKQLVNKVIFVELVGPYGWD